MPSWETPADSMREDRCICGLIGLTVLVGLIELSSRPLQNQIGRFTVVLKADLKKKIYSAGHMKHCDHKKIFLDDEPLIENKSFQHSAISSAIELHVGRGHALNFSSVAVDARSM
jgi:hypothetical protein